MRSKPHQLNVKIYLAMKPGIGVVGKLKMNTLEVES